MNVVINRLDPNVPDPVESRRRAAGRVVRVAYAAFALGIIGFFFIYFITPLVFLSGPGSVSARRYVLSLPYTVQVSRMSVEPGAAVQAGAEIGQVRSPEQDTIVATYMRALADIAIRSAELRIKTRVAKETLEASRAYQRQTEEAIERVEALSGATMMFRIEILRERALANKGLIAQEAEVAEATTQLSVLDAISQQMRQRLDEVERDFAGGQITAPIAGIVSTGLAHSGQSLLAGTPIAEILDPKDVYVDWYIPNDRLMEPKVGKEVFVLFGQRRIQGKIAEILPVSAVYASTQPQVALRDRPATQIARVRFDPQAWSPALNSSVYVHTHYIRLSAWIAEWVITLLGLD